MKTRNTFSVLAALLAIVFFAKTSFAASDYLLELDGIKGECKGKHIKLTENSDGTFSAQDIPGGTYTVIYKAKAGKTGATKRTTDNTASLSFTYQKIEWDCIVSPRDVATGQSSGKRMHKPFVITKELDKTAPSTTVGEVTVGDVDGDGMADRNTGDPIHGVDVKLGAKAKGSPTTATYDLVMAKK